MLVQVLLQDDVVFCRQIENLYRYLTIPSMFYFITKFCDCSMCSFITRSCGSSFRGYGREFVLGGVLLEDDIWWTRIEEKG